jgi:hypothetical protein
MPDHRKTGRAAGPALLAWKVVMVVFAPRQLDKVVRDFCRSINPGREPVLVPVRAHPGSKP